MKENLTPGKFYALNFTWGLPVNIGGAAVALAMLATGHKPHKFGECVQFDVGKGWGGGSLGIFMFTCKDAPDSLKAHEHGHSIQNCYFGPLMPFAVNLPSSARYWARRAVQAARPSAELPPYDSVWFESQATTLGTDYIAKKKQQADKKE